LMIRPSVAVVQRCRTGQLVQWRRKRAARVSVITARTALKIRSRSSEARSLLRHSVSTVGWNASSVSANPAAAFQAMFVAS
jgi:hypothetical protein